MNILRYKMSIKLGLFLWMVLTLNACRADPEVTETVTITFAGYEYHRPLYEPLIATFQETQTAIKVQFVAIDAAVAEESNSLNLRQVASTADVALLDAPFSNQSSSYFLDVAPFIAADDTFNTADFWPGLVDGCQSVGVPITVGATFIIFDEAAFDAVGLPRPAPGWTWTDFQHAARTLTHREGERVVRYGFVDNGQPRFLLGPLVDGLLAEAGASLDADRVATELEWYVDLVRAGVVPIFEDYGGVTAVADSNLFIENQQAAMWLGNLVDLTRRYNDPDQEIGIAPFPVPQNAVAKTNNSTTPIRPTCAVISAGTTHPDASWVWINYLTQQTIPDPIRPISSRPSIAKTSAYWGSLDAETEVALHASLNNGWYGSYASPTLKTVTEALIQALTHNASLAATLTDFPEIPATPPPAPEETPITVAMPQTTPTPITPSVSDEVLIVDYFVDSSDYLNVEAIEALAQTFNEAHRNIIVRPSDDRSAFQGTYGVIEIAKQYDCLALGGAAKYYPIEQFYSLEPLLSAEESAFRDDFFPALFEENTVDGQLYGLPIVSQPFLVYYNAEYLRGKNLEPPTMDWTNDDFWTWVTAATQTGGDERVYGFVPFIWSTMDYLSLMPQAVELYDVLATPPVVNFDAPEAIQTLAWLNSMVEAGAMFPKTKMGFDTILQQERIIRGGQAALWIDLAGSEADYPFEVGVAPLPQTSLPQPLAAGKSLYISRRASNPSGCWEWLKFLSAQPNVFRGIPSRRSVLNSPAWTAAVGSQMRDVSLATLARPVRDELNEDNPNRFISFPFYVWWEDALTDAFSGLDTSSTLGNIQPMADAYLSCILAVEDRTFEQVEACAGEVDAGYN